MPAFAFSEGQRLTLAAICDTVIAELSAAEEESLVKQKAALGIADTHVRAFCRSKGSDLGVPEAIESTLREHAPADLSAGIATLLSVMSSRMGMLLLCGKAAPFAALSPAEREQCLNSLQNSMFGQKRLIFTSLKGLIGIKTFGRDTRETNPHNEDPQVNSLWAACGYEGPAPSADVEKASSSREEYLFQMINKSIAADTELSFDAVVVGSGCGGAVAAAELSRAGKRVLVLEKGRYYRRDELTGVEHDALDGMYERGGLVATEDTSIAVLAGATFGGGSAVNWACSLRPPNHLRQEWAEQYGLPKFTSAEFDQSVETVCKRIGVVNGDQISHNANNELMLKGCRASGYSIEVTGQNMADTSPSAPGAGFISIGDRYQIKQSMLHTFLKDAAMAVQPAQFAERCFVERIIHRSGQVVGVEARIIGSDGTSRRLTVKAPVVAVCCGSLHSPALLLRSKLPNRNGQIGKNLRLHPVTLVNGIVPDSEPEVAVWRGAPMTTVSNECALGPAGDHYGSKLECPSMHPGLGASALTWTSRSNFKELMSKLNRVFSVIVLSRDKDSGEVRLGKEGEPRLYYPHSKRDRQSLLQGTEKAIRAVAATGVTHIAAAHLPMRALPPPSQAKARSAEVDRLVEDLKRSGIRDGSVFCAHQMGSCRMGSNPNNSVVKDNCESWECSGLYVLDASVFPTSSGVNPMLTTLSIAHMASQGIVSQLTQGGKHSSFVMSRL